MTDFFFLVYQIYLVQKSFNKKDTMLCLISCISCITTFIPEVSKFFLKPCLLCVPYLLGVAVIILHCDSLCSDIADVKFLICFMKHHVNMSSLMVDKIYKLSRIRRILVWPWVDLNQIYSIMQSKFWVYSWNASKYWLFIWKATNILREIQKYFMRILP